MLDKLVEKVDGILTLSFEDKCSLAAQGMFEFFEKQIREQEAEKQISLSPISIGNLLVQQNSTASSLCSYIINTISETHGELSELEVKQVNLMVQRLWQRVIMPAN